MSSSYSSPSSSALAGEPFIHSSLSPVNPPTLHQQATSVDGSLELEASYDSLPSLPNVSNFRRRYRIRPHGIPLPNTTPTRCVSAPAVLVATTQAHDLLPLPSPNRSQLQHSADSAPTPIAPVTLFATSGVNMVPTPQGSSIILDVGDGGTLSWSAANPSVELFFATHNPVGLQVNWRLSSLDGCGELGQRFLERLFNFFNPDDKWIESLKPPTIPLLVSDLEPSLPPLQISWIENVEQVGISVPEQVLDVEERAAYIDLHRASRLREFTWKGDWSLLARNFRQIPWGQLTLLHIIDTTLSVTDALALLNECFHVIDVRVQITTPNNCRLLKPSELPTTMLPRLEHLHIVSPSDLRHFLLKLESHRLESLTLECQENILTALNIISLWDIRLLRVPRHLNEALVAKIRKGCPKMKIHFLT